MRTASKGLLEGLRERDSLEDLGVDGRLMLKRNFKNGIGF
jgi:hypothetical protein